MDHQDWDTIYITANTELNKKNKKKDKKVGKQLSTEKKLENKIQEGNLKHKKISKELSTQIQKERLRLKMTRKDLAHKINIPLKIIDDIENGIAMYNPQHVNKIKRILKMNS